VEVRETSFVVKGTLLLLVATDQLSKRATAK
jgi:hypothetical protein